MSVLNILHYPDSRLRIKAKPVTKIDNTIRQLVDDMLETMYQAPGIGLAATQVDVHLRVIVIDISEDKSEPLVLINPEIIARDGVEKSEEGCLSVPEINETVERAEHVVVRSQTLEGTEVKIDAHDLLAVCIQHEMDHLVGKLFVDYLSEMKRNRITKKLLKLQKVSASG
ncbi:Peptide deformylase [hydrothermal vent metagenome]|uniref:Peptide deformylase n=1 Tax=hydrothermal vent metagenome TaxID=652676 RepID=A0A3B1AJG7_9ZZZZ